MNRAVPLVAAAAVGFGAGFVVSRVISPVASPVSSSREPSAAVSGSPAASLTREEKRSLPFALPVAGDPDALLAAIDDASRVGNPIRRLGRIAAVMEQIDPASAPRVVDFIVNDWKNGEKTFGLFSEKSITLLIAMMSWADQDPRGAMEYAQDLPEEIREDAIGATLGAWAISDYPSARDFAVQTADVAQRADYEWTVRNAIIEADPRLAVEEVLNDPESFQKAGFVPDAFLELAETDARAAAGYAAQLPEGRDRESIIGSIARIWMRSDPGEALALVEGFSDEETRLKAMESLVDPWSEQDFDGAMAWVRQRPAGTRRDALVEAVLRDLVREDPRSAIDYVDLISSESRQDSLINAIAKSWVKDDIVSALAWGREQVDPSIRGAVWSGIVEGIAEGKRPQDAVSILDELPADRRAEAVRLVAQRWAFRDPRSAVDWALREANEDSRLNGLNVALTRWIETDSETWQEWMKKFPNGPRRDEVIEQSLNSLTRKDRFQAMELASRMTDAKRRNSHLESLAADWMRADSVSAIDWIQKSNLPPDIQNRLLSGARR